MSASLPAGRPDFRPTAALATLRRRAAILRSLRAFFETSGYWEVETPILSHDVCVDAWLNPLEIAQAPQAGEHARSRLFLQTSPEFAMKRLLAAGADAIYQITHAFRQGECGQRHNPEFTMLEWYRTAATYFEQMDFVELLVLTALQAAGRERPAAARPFRRLSYDQAFAEFAGMPILQLPTAELPHLARRHGVRVPVGMTPQDRDGWLNLLLAEVVEPGLAQYGAVFLFDYPASQAALAIVRPGPPAVAERFELYLEGLEICNGYQELTDADELARRMVHQAGLRQAAGLPALPTDSRLQAAMQTGLPPSSGVALGFDRLVMWCLGAASISEVIPFPFDRA